MKDKDQISTQDIFSRIKIERDVYAGRGKYKTINARRVVWEMLDYLIDKAGYPVEELIDECIALDGEGMLEWSFEEAVIRAIIADRMIEDGYANYNFITDPDPVTGRAFVPITSPVWKMHQKNNPAKFCVSKIVGIETATAHQYTSTYQEFVGERAKLLKRQKGHINR